MALDDEDEGLLNNFAWVLATSPDDEVRDGKRSIELATKAAELTSYTVPHILSTLAAAYAETGDFDEAKKWSQKSIDVCQTELDAAKTDDDRKRLEADLGNLKKELAELRQTGKPVREQQKQEDASSRPRRRRAATRLRRLRRCRRRRGRWISSVAGLRSERWLADRTRCP